MRLPKTWRGPWIGLAAAVCILATGPAVGGEAAMTPAERQAIEQVVREYLRDNPEILVDAIRALRVKQEIAKRAEARRALAGNRQRLDSDPDSPVAGDARGDVTVVEFFDYRCTYCKRVFPSIMALLETDRRIRYVFKEFPILGPASDIAARAALAAWYMDQSAYLPLHRALMAAKGGLTEGRIMRFAEDVGLDIAELRRTMKGSRVEAQLKANFELARALGINGTPAFVIGSEIVPGAADIASLRRLIAAARKG